MKSRSSNSLYLTAAVFGAAILIAAVFFTRFSLPGFLLTRLIDPLVGMLLVLLASYAIGALCVHAADTGDQLLLGIPLYGLALSVISIAGFANPIAIGGFTILAAIYGAIRFVGGGRLARLAGQRPAPLFPLLIPPILLAFLGAIAPVNTPDELTYKLAVPHLYLQFGRMLDLPLNSNAYIPSAVYMADLGALVLSGGIAAKLVHFVIYLLALRVIHRTARELSESGAMWMTAVIAWTPALAVIAGWAWAEWAMIGFVLLSFLHWQRGNLTVAAIALGVALSSKYTALPWAVVFIALAIWRDRRAVLKPALLVAATGSFFYIRNWVWTGSPIAPFLLPNAPAVADYRSTLGGWAELARGYDIFHPAIVDDALGILLPALILLSPLALLWRNRKIVDLFILGAAQLIGLITLAPTSRLMMLALVPLALLGAFVTVRVWESANRAIRVALAGVAGIALFGHLVLIAFTFVERWSVIPYLIGVESETAYLERTRDFMKPYAWIDEHTPENAKLLLLAENRPYYLDRRALAGGNLDGPRVAAWLARFPSPDAFARELQREGVTHVLVHKPWYRVGAAWHSHSIVEKEFVLAVTPETNAMVHAFVAQRTRKVFEDPSYAIYELRR